MKKTILITGASDGIGKACALLFAELGASLILISRNQDKLQKVEKLCRDAGCNKIDSFALDVGDWNLVQKMAANYLEPIDVIINNAGVAKGKDQTWQAPYEDVKETLRTNVEGTLNICRAFIPRLLSQKTGDIINVSSIAAHQSYPGGNVYCASKHAIRAITDAMRAELLGSGLRVMMISPGMVETNFSVYRYKGDVVMAKNVYKGITPLVADDIAKTLHFMLSRPRHVCIADLIIYPTNQASVRDILRDAP